MFHISFNAADVRRVLWTFAEAIVVFAGAHFADIKAINSLSGAEQIALAALVAGVAAVKNLLLSDAVK